MTTTPGGPGRYTLPHTEMTVPLPVRVVDYQELETHDGVAHTCRLIVDGVDVGKMENTGHGGPTTLYPHSSEHRPAWKALIDGARNRHGDPMDEEDLADELTHEAYMEAEVCKVQRSRTKYAVRITSLENLLDDGDADEIRDVLPFKFAKAVDVTDENVTKYFGQATRRQLPERLVRADVWLKDHWKQFFPTT
ncbi:hypothetical protein ACFVWN_00895 [Nocardiopsis flavescens]|uniref:hypothetical protein n=1 Tax=Nocardiopsis flavescens TaxID=758803 RepID=UPI00364A486A